MKPVSIRLKEGSKPYQGRYYNIPKAYEQPTRKEIDKVMAINVLMKLSYDNYSPWASQMFAQSKKTVDICILTDFENWMTAFKGSHFLYQGLVKLYKSWRTWSQQRRWISLKDSIPFLLTIFQSIMMELLGDLEHVLVYIDDILIV